VPAKAEEERWMLPGHAAESQGRLHYINREPVAHDSEQSPRLLCTSGSLMTMMHKSGFWWTQ
jgi:hypothetical protein